MANTSTQPPDVAPVQAPCPRCEKPLVDPHGLGWCPACGYCRSLDEGQARLPLQKAVAEPSPSAPIPVGGAVKFPVWILTLIAGVVLLAASCYAVQRSVQLTPMHRAIWTASQILAGVVLALLGQVYALFRIAPEEASLHFHDAIVPFRLYGMVFKRLPRMCLTILFGGWGLTLVLSALICVGGLGHWLNYIPKSRNSQSANWQ